MTAVFDVRVTNHGGVADTFEVKVPAAGTGWVLKAFDALKDGTEITTDITSLTGWTTPNVEVGSGATFRIEVAPDPLVTGPVTSSSLVSVTSVLDSTATDAVKGT